MFSLNKYAVNNFKEISVLEKKISEKKVAYDKAKNEKFEALQKREKKYWEKWNELVSSGGNWEILQEPCPEKKNLKDKFKKKNKEIKKKIYDNFIQREVNVYKKISNEFGDIEKEYIALQRELEEVSDNKYFGRIIKESDDKFYLALTERLNEKNEKKSLNELDVLKSKFSDDGDLEVLNFYKLSFSAFEKLCLLPESTLGVNTAKDKKIRSLWRQIKLSRFEEIIIKYKWNKEISKSDNFSKKKIYEGKENQNKLKEDSICQIVEYFEKIVEKHNHLFPAKFDFDILKNTQSFKEFEKEFNKQGYKISYQKISKEQLLKLEKGGEILLFQIFCKDFVLDEKFALTEFDKTRVEFDKTRIDFESKGKDNLHTRYIKEFFQNIEDDKFWNKWRLFGEGKLFFRESDNTPNISRRYKDDKFFLSLGFQIYPNTQDIKKEVKYSGTFQEKHIKQINDKIKNHLKPKYVIGLDQGVNSLVSYCVIDLDGNIAKDENGKYEIGDLSLVISSEGKRQGEFVEVEDTQIENDKGVWNEKDKVLEQKERNDRVLKSDNSIKVCDYAEAIYAESYKRKKEIKKYEADNPEENKIELEKITDLKRGYASHLLHKIEQLAKKYSPAIISLECMEDTKRKNNFLNKKGDTKNIEKQKIVNPKLYRFGTSTVEAIEEALLKKFGYWNGKVNQSGAQLVPEVVKKSDFYGKGVQWGNIVFVDESNTSVICPKCGKNGVRCKNPLDLQDWKKAEVHSEELVREIYGQFRKVKERVRHELEDSCNWDSADSNREFPEIRNGDDLASYNIAKRGLEFIKGKPKK
jgi:hypothetical protein